jgi:hypothetical protein
MKNEHTTTALMTAFMTGVCLTICIGAIFKTEDIQTLEDARRIYGLIAITATASVFMALFTLIEYEMSNHPTNKK